MRHEDGCVQGGFGSARFILKNHSIATKLSKALVAFALSKTEEGKSYNLEHDLEEFAKHLFVEENQKYIDGLKEVGVADCLSVRNELREKSQAFEQELLKYSKAFEDFIQQYPLRPNSFYKGYFYNYLTNLKHIDQKGLHIAP